MDYSINIYLDPVNVAGGAELTRIYNGDLRNI